MWKRWSPACTHHVEITFVEVRHCRINVMHNGVSLQCMNTTARLLSELILLAFTDNSAVYSGKKSLVLEEKVYSCLL